jgi:arylsulfatase A-like enzyme
MSIAMLLAARKVSRRTMPRNSVRHLLMAIGLAAAIVLPARIGAAADPPAGPNIIVILADDLGYGDLGCCGAADIRTPHLDRMAAEGMRFTDFSVVAPLCTPSRVALMTGVYPGRFGLAVGVLRPNATAGVPQAAVTLADVVKPRGYATGCIGKWHLGFQSGMRPLDQGFDSYFGVLHNLDQPETVCFEAEGGMPVLRNDAVVRRPAVPAEMTGLYTDEALRFIEAHRDGPFLLYLGHAMPHLPFDASPPFKGRSARGLYGDVVEELDWSTGQILDRVRSLGLAEHTLVLFTSDNGPERKTGGSADPLRGTKHTVYEGGVRVPLVAWWPGHVPAGRTCNEFLSALDVLPTIAHLAGATPPGELDGADFSAVLLGEPQASSSRETLLTLYGYLDRRQEAIRAGHWKLHLTGRPQLYDLKNDLGETVDLADRHPDVVRRLEDAARAIREATRAGLRIGIDSKNNP